MGKTTLILIFVIILIIISIISYGIYVVVDWDYDGISTAEEINLGTDPNKRDTDGDGVSDYDEVYIYKTNPLTRDTDGDGLSDLDELTIHQTDPLKQDTDGDGISDYNEVYRYGINPLLYDTDNDGLTDYDEIFTYNTNPVNPDSDGDGLLDGYELKIGANPLSPDSDGDGISDYDEANVYGTSPLNQDSDGDGVVDSIDLCPCGDLVLNLTIIEWRELEPDDVGETGDPYIVIQFGYVYNNTIYRLEFTIPLGLNVSYLANKSYIIDLPDGIPSKLLAVVIKVFDNDTVDGQAFDYQYYIAYMNEAPVGQYECYYTLFELLLKSTTGEDASLIFRIETVCLKTS